MSNYNSVEALLKFVKLTVEDFPLSDAQTALDEANALVLVYAPLEDSDRSDRFEPIRKKAEIYLAAAEVYQQLANIFFMNSPPIRILNVLNFGAGADSPTPTELLSALRSQSDYYREQGMSLLRTCKPLTATIRAGG